MFQSGAFSPMNATPLRLGQPTAAVWWPAEGLSTVQRWDQLLARLSQVADGPTREEILAWVGRSDIPGTPAERYQVVAEDLATSFAPETDEAAAELRRRLDLLKNYTTQLDAKVRNAEQAYGTLSAPAGAGSMSERGMMMQCVTGGIALIGLIILPLILD